MSAVDRKHPIAVFDSGVGGLTVLHECLVWLPHEDFVYLGDTARFPYGGRAPDELRARSLAVAEALQREGAKMIVVACNSATSAALPALRDAFGEGLAVIGTVEPAARLAAAATRSGRIGLLATPATVASGAYEQAIAGVAPDAQVTSVACPKLAPLIQAGGELDARVVALVDEYCEPLKEAGVDTVVLGCTHYPLVRAVLQRALGRGVTIVSSGQAIADDVERLLAERGVENDSDRRGSYRFLCTGDEDEFRALAARSLQLPVERVERVAIESAPARAAA
ncbi:MAG: glutamate racemase [Thermoleophilaceae bacterium]|nr:glutamate racemase [Thermoleophilaceae bacterium]